MISVVPLTGALLTGRNTWGPITPPLGTRSVQLAVDRTGLALLTQQVNWTAELSIDAGATWRSWGGAGCPAGQLLDINSAVITESSFTVNLPAPADANTRLRGSITTLEPLTTTLTVRMN
jgi:hypothetical protein